MKVTYRRLDLYKYQLLEPYAISLGIQGYQLLNHKYLHLDMSGNLVILTGYAWDGASGPAINTQNFVRGSLVHDAMYQLMRLQVLEVEQHRLLADQMLRKICLEDGMSFIRASWVYAGVRLGGKSSAEPKPDPVEALEAP